MSRWALGLQCTHTRAGRCWLLRSHRTRPWPRRWQPCSRRSHRSRRPWTRRSHLRQTQPEQRSTDDAAPPSDAGERERGRQGGREAGAVRAPKPPVAGLLAAAPKPPKPVLAAPLEAAAPKLNAIAAARRPSSLARFHTMRIASDDLEKLSRASFCSRRGDDRRARERRAVRQRLITRLGFRSAACARGSGAVASLGFEAPPTRSQRSAPPVEAAPSDRSIRAAGHRAADIELLGAPLVVLLEQVGCSAERQRARSRYFSCSGSSSSTSSRTGRGGGSRASGACACCPPAHARNRRERIKMISFKDKKPATEPAEPEPEPEARRTGDFDYS
jgi:hypothetical protein